MTVTWIKGEKYAQSRRTCLSEPVYTEPSFTNAHSILQLLTTFATCVKGKAWETSERCEGVHTDFMRVK